MLYVYRYCTYGVCFVCAYICRVCYTYTGTVRMVCVLYVHTYVECVIRIQVLHGVCFVCAYIHI